MIYKELLDSIITGSLDAEEMWKALRLQPNLQFGESFRLHVNTSVGEKGRAADNLSQLWKWTVEQVQFLPKVSRLKVEYCYQEEGKVFATEEVEHDPEWLKETLERHMEYWKGTRVPKGVEVEDAWKCSGCHFQEGCEWRLAKIQELAKKSNKC